LRPGRCSARCLPTPVVPVTLSCLWKTFRRGTALVRSATATGSVHASDIESTNPGIDSAIMSKHVRKQMAQITRKDQCRVSW
jgi:hypothetical protein